MQRRREGKKTNSLPRQNNNFARASCFFVHLFDVTARLQRENFFLCMNLDMGDRNSAPEEFACIRQSKRVGIITIETEFMHFSCDVLWLSAVVAS